MANETEFKLCTGGGTWRAERTGRAISAEAPVGGAGAEGEPALRMLKRCSKFPASPGGNDGGTEVRGQAEGSRNKVGGLFFWGTESTSL